MPILNGDIKLVASQVMNDVAEGGGAPTSIVITDGASNAIFPDISELDRAGGRVNLRKLHVTVQTDDTDTAMPCETPSAGAEGKFNPPVQICATSAAVLALNKLYHWILTSDKQIFVLRRFRRFAFALSPLPC